MIKYKVATGTQAHRGILLGEQGGGRQGGGSDDSDDYEVLKDLFLSPLCSHFRIRWLWLFDLQYVEFHIFWNNWIIENVDCRFSKELLLELGIRLHRRRPSLESSRRPLRDQRSQLRRLQWDLLFQRQRRQLQWSIHHARTRDHPVSTQLYDDEWENHSVSAKTALSSSSILLAKLTSTTTPCEMAVSLFFSFSFFILIQDLTLQEAIKHYSSSGKRRKRDTTNSSPTSTVDVPGVRWKMVHWSPLPFYLRSVSIGNVAKMASLYSPWFHVDFSIQFGSCEYANKNFNGGQACIEWFVAMEEPSETETKVSTKWIDDAHLLRDSRGQKLHARSHLHCMSIVIDLLSING